MDNAVLVAIRERRSTHEFTSEPVTDRQLTTILDAGRWAPSGLNSQPWDFIVVRDPQVRADVASVLKRITIAWEGFAAAPVMIVVSVDRLRDPAHYVEDGAVAAQNMCLAAHSLGLATSWAGVHAARAGRGSVESEIMKLVALPRTHRIVAVVPVGFAYGAGQKSSRIPLEEMVHDEQFRPNQRYRSERS